MEDEKKPRVIIIGGGFAGVNTAKQLEKLDKISLILISDKKWHDYKARIFKIIEENNLSSVKIPLEELIDQDKIILDKIKTIDLNNQQVQGENGIYEYDYLVLATGSTPNYHGISVVEKLTYTVNSSIEAMRLLDHIEKTLQKMKDADPTEKISMGHFVVVGGGGTGVEMAAAVSTKCRRYAKEIGLDASFITVDLFHSGSIVLENLRPALSRAVEKRLRSLGVNIFYHRRISKEHLQSISIGDIHIKASTIIWTAGVEPNKLIHYQRESIDDHLRLKDHTKVYVIGDAGDDQYYGMAQTAIEHALYVSKDIKNRLSNGNTSKFIPKSVYYAVPLGSYWAAVQSEHFIITGLVGWLIRRIIDLRYLIRRIPLIEVFRSFRGVPKNGYE